ncbi:MucR family transcriptional regulator [Salipiger pallidus]|uniref:MucR family transcriptional regulator n=1 Tax=Salipiger pallidus TaxID=1775170 RepID=A0A8J2ZI95_9RHOB|nr:MucR family transcriptional regulator [Salipiger pallidus]GGG67601.1 MucR family transcriptional regulator [Salipiger pallidus]
MSDLGIKEETLGRIVAAYASRKDVGQEEIITLYRRLAAELGGPVPQPVSAPAVTADGQVQPAVPVEKAVTEDKVTCLCCGRSFKMLKRHLGAEHGMTEAAYRTAFGLPEDFPLVAPSYSRKKAAHAREAGLGTYARSIVPGEA